MEFKKSMKIKLNTKEEQALREAFFTLDDCISEMMECEIKEISYHGNTITLDELLAANEVLDKLTITKQKKRD